MKLPTPKELALTAYYYASLHKRRGEAIVRAARFGEPVRILFYHRIADHTPNRWTISRAAFAAQINWLRLRFDLVSLAEAQARVESGHNRFPTACITFDDGYAENLEFAIPLLLKHKIPFTYFVATDFVANNRPFPHDVAAGRPLAVNTLDDIRKLAGAGVEIGAHTRTHANLGGPLSPEQLVSEIVGSKRDLEAAIDKPVRYFAFPYGQHENLTGKAFEVAYATGFAGVCSAYGGYNFPGDEAFHLRRFHADEAFIRFLNWMSVDSRKVQRHRDFQTGDYRRAGETVPCRDEIIAEIARASAAQLVVTAPVIVE